MEAENTGSPDAQAEGSLTVLLQGAGQWDRESCLN